MAPAFSVFAAAAAVVTGAGVVGASELSFEPRGDLHFPLHARATNTDGSTPVYKDATQDTEARVADLLPRMTLEEKVSQLIQGDINGWMNMTDPYDDTHVYDVAGLKLMMQQKGGSIWAGYLAPWAKLAYGIEVGQRYLMENTTLGIPALIQSEGLHGFPDNGTVWPSPIGLAASFNPALLQKAAATIADETEGLGINTLFAPVLDLARELRWGRVEENYGEDPYLTAEMARAYVNGVQKGQRRGVGKHPTARMAANCKHFAAFGSPQGGLNIAPVAGGERELRTYYLRPFQRACMDSLTLMTAYSSYDGVPATADTHLLIDILRNEWGYKYWATTDAGAVDNLISVHGVCGDRACAAKKALYARQGEMGGGSYTYLTLPDQVRNGSVDVSHIDETVKTLLRTKFELGLFENPYPYPDYEKSMRTQSTRKILYQMEQEAIVLLENRNSVLPLSASIGSIAVIGPHAAEVVMGDYIFEGDQSNGISALAGIKAFLSDKGSGAKVNYAEGCKLWNTDESGFDAAKAAAQASDVAVVLVGTWSLDQQHLWAAGTNATTGEHVDVSDLGLVGAQRALVQAIKATGKPTVVVFVSGKPVAEPWIAAHADAVIQQFYPGELGGAALADVLFGAVSPSGRLPVSFPRSVGTAPAFYNYLKGARPLDPGAVLDDGRLQFGHQYVLDSPVPLWSFGHGLSYVNFTYSNLQLSKSTISAGADFSVSVTVANTGKMDAHEVVQVYATDLVSSVVTANTELVGFAKVAVGAGKSVTVKVDVEGDLLAVWTRQNKFVVEPGQFRVRVGTSDQTYAQTILTVS